MKFSEFVTTARPKYLLKMFAKPYKHKSNNTLKNSEKKHLVQRVQDEFSLASDERAKELVPGKSSCVCMKVVLHSGDSVNVYAVDGLPMLVETAGGLVPTVCALWKVPDLVPTLDIHTPVFSKVQGGAPLYLPGVSLPACGAGFPVFPCGTVLAARTQDNAAACLVGRAAMSSADMLLRASGVCLDTLHCYGDQLCKDNRFNRIERPKLTHNTTVPDFTLATQVQQLSLQPAREEWPSLGQQWPSLPTQTSTTHTHTPATHHTPTHTPTPTPVPNEPRLIVEDTPIMDVDEHNEDDQLMVTESNASDIPSDTEGLLRWCLLSFLKLEGKNVELPLKVNLLYKNHMQPYCPSDRSIDVKKSSYKKFGKFLEAMQMEGLVEVRELDKGVSSIVAINIAHASVRRHRPRDVTPVVKDDRDYIPPTVREMFCVTAVVLPLFQNLKKGTALTPPEVRTYVSEYVKMKGLTSTQVKGAVSLDAVLANIVGKPQQESVKWDALMSCVHSKMTASTQMTFSDGTITLSKSKLEPVTMQVDRRSGNKKVTLVSNLEQFGFSLPALASVAQAGAAATCGVTRSPGAKADQLMLQGDQTHFVAKLLIEKYGLPKKFLDGADKALNKKNK